MAPISSNVRLGNKSRPGNCKVADRSVVVIAVVAEAEFVGDVRSEVVVLGQRDQLVAGRERAPEGGQVGRGVQCVLLVVDVAAAEVVLRRDRPVAAGYDRFVVRVSGTSDGKKADSAGTMCPSGSVSAMPYVPFGVMTGRTVLRRRHQLRGWGRLRRGLGRAWLAGDAGGCYVLVQDAEVSSVQAIYTVHGRETSGGRGAGGTDNGLPDGLILERSVVEELVLQHRSANLSAEAVVVVTLVLGVPGADRGLSIAFRSLFWKYSYARP